MTLIASLSMQGMGEALILDEAAFEIYIEQVLAPSLKAGQIVILDNLSIHQGTRVRQAIKPEDVASCFCLLTRPIYPRLRKPSPN